tara:strand:- start:6300 stop:6761 length:462 start_codon:yes stop_codon:yes gene_type:complete
VSVHFSSDKSDWATPSVFFHRLHAEFNFTLDVCASPHNAKVSKFFTEQDDGLKQHWHGICWMNPPYGRQINQWIKKAYDSACLGDATVVALIPSRTDTKWWHDYVLYADDIRFVKGRLKFNNHSNSAPFPSAVVIWRKGINNKEYESRLFSTM